VSVVVEPSAIRLSGRCLVDDVEPLLAALLEHPERPVDVAGIQKLHLAVLQVLLAAQREVTGLPDNAFVAQHLQHLCDDRRNATR
jgi:hypothetical protein